MKGRCDQKQKSRWSEHIKHLDTRKKVHNQYARLFHAAIHNRLSCTQPTAHTHTHRSGVGVLTWCYQSRWCETASPVLPRSGCHRRRKPETHPEKASHHLQESKTRTNTHTNNCEKQCSRKQPFLFAKNARLVNIDVGKLPVLVSQSVFTVTKCLKRTVRTHDA